LSLPGDGPGGFGRTKQHKKRNKTNMSIKKITFIAALAFAVVALSFTSQAASANPFGLGLPSQVLVSGNINGPGAPLVCTNGLYPQSISSGVTTNNLVLVNCAAPATVFGGGGSPNGVLLGNSLALQFNGAATATNGGGAYTATYVLYASVQPPSLSTGGTNGACYNANGMQLFDTVTLALSGVPGTITVTNKVYSVSTTPGKGAIPYIYIYSIGASGATLTNYSVWANSQ
jgi:hypothetical protein